MIDSLLLGLSSGSACLVTCGIVMFPYLMSGSAGLKRITVDLSVFLLTRFIVYFFLATGIWYFGKTLLSSPILRTYVSGIFYIVFAVMLIWYSIGKNKERNCPVRIVKTVEDNKLVPFMLGIVNSLGFCPALLLMVTKGVSETSLATCYLSFLSFFVGSSIWFFPLPFLGRLKRREVIQTVGILATGLAGVIFIVKGLTILIGGILYG